MQSGRREHDDGRRPRRPCAVAELPVGIRAQHEELSDLVVVAPATNASLARPSGDFLVEWLSDPSPPRVFVTMRGDGEMILTASSQVRRTLPVDE